MPMGSDTSGGDVAAPCGLRIRRRTACRVQPARSRPGGLLPGVGCLGYSVRRISLTLFPVPASRPAPAGYPLVFPVSTGILRLVRENFPAASIQRAVRPRSGFLFSDSNSRSDGNRQVT